MRIETIPRAADDMLHQYQRHEIVKRIEEPIAAIHEQDPDWERVDDLLTAVNNVITLSRDRDVICTIHEILPGVQAAWIADDHTYEDPSSSEGQWILINAADLQSIRYGGKPGLMVDRLFRDF